MWVQRAGGGGVDAIAYAPDGRTLYTLDRTGTLSAWDAATRTGRRVRSISKTVFGVTHGIHPLADGRVVGVGHALVVWDERSETTFGTVPRDWSRRVVRVTPDGRAHFIDEDSRQFIGIDLNTGAPLPTRTAPGFGPNMRRFDLTADEKSVAVSFEMGAPVVVYEWGAGPELRNPVTLKSAWDVRFSPDGRVLALSTGGPPRVTLYDTATWQPRAEIAPCWITDAAFAVNPVLPVVAAVSNGSLTLFSLETGAVIRSLDFELGTRTRCVCFSPDGLTCAAGGSNKRFVVFDVDL